MLPSTRELAGVTAQRDTVKMEVDAMNAAMAEQGVHVSEGTMYMVAQVKMIAELRDLLGVQAAHQWENHTGCGVLTMAGEGGTPEAQTISCTPS
ncbi:unnamed protein product, partial [Scytosiphon promiscuus]